VNGEAALDARQALERVVQRGRAARERVLAGLLDGGEVVRHALQLARPAQQHLIAGDPPGQPAAPDRRRGLEVDAEAHELGHADRAEDRAEAVRQQARGGAADVADVAERGVRAAEVDRRLVGHDRLASDRPVARRAEPEAPVPAHAAARQTVRAVHAPVGLARPARRRPRLARAQPREHRRHHCHPLHPVPPSTVDDRGSLRPATGSVAGRSRLLTRAAQSLAAAAAGRSSPRARLPYDRWTNAP
jgi:hypothetical protein